MKGRLFFEILAVLLIIIICAGFVILKNHFSSRALKEEEEKELTRSEEILEIRNNMLSNIENPEERISIVEDMIKRGRISVEEGDFILGVTHEE